MGVDYYACKSCGDTFSDCGYFVICECGMRWCSDECAEADGYKCEEHEVQRMQIDEEISCNFCRGEDVEDYEIVSYVLKLLGLTREEIVSKMKEE